MQIYIKLAQEVNLAGILSKKYGYILIDTCTIAILGEIKWSEIF